MERNKIGLDGIGNWECFIDRSHAKQTDSLSCGVYVLRVSTVDLKEKKLIFFYMGTELDVESRT